MAEPTPERAPERPVRLSFSGLQVQFDALQADWNKYQSNQLRSRPTSRVEQNGEDSAAVTKPLGALSDASTAARLSSNNSSSRDPSGGGANAIIGNADLTIPALQVVIPRLAAVAEEGSPIHPGSNPATALAPRQHQRSVSLKKPNPAAPTVPRRSGSLSNRSKSTPRGMSSLRKTSQVPPHQAASPSPQPIVTEASDPSLQQQPQPRAVSVGRLATSHIAQQAPAQPITGAPSWSETVPKHARPFSPTADNSKKGHATQAVTQHPHPQPTSPTPASQPLSARASPTKGNTSSLPVRLGPASPPQQPRPASPNRMSRILYSTNHHQHAADDLTCHHHSSSCQPSVPRATSCTQERNHHATAADASAPTRSKIPRSMFYDPASVSGDLSHSGLDAPQQHISSSPRRYVPRDASQPESTVPLSAMAAAAVIAAPSYRSPTKRRQWDKQAAAAAAASSSASASASANAVDQVPSLHAAPQQRRVSQGQTPMHLPSAHAGAPSDAAHSASQQNAFPSSDLPLPQRHASTGTLIKLQPQAPARVSVREVPFTTSSTAAAAAPEVGDYTGYRIEVSDPSFRPSPGVPFMPSFIGWSTAAAPQAVNAWATPLLVKAPLAAPPVVHKAVPRHRPEAKSSWQHVDGSVASSIDAHPLPWTAPLTGSSSAGGHIDAAAASESAATSSFSSHATGTPAASLLSSNTTQEYRGQAAEPASSDSAAAAAGDHMARNGSSAPYRARDSALYMRKLSALKRGPTVPSDGATSSRRVSDSNCSVGRAAVEKEGSQRVGVREKRESNGFPTPVPEDNVLSEDDIFPTPSTANHSNSAQQPNPPLPAASAAAPYNVAAARQSLINNLLKARKRVSHGQPSADPLEVSDSAQPPATTSEYPIDSAEHDHANGATHSSPPLPQQSSSPPLGCFPGEHSHQQFQQDTQQTGLAMLGPDQFLAYAVQNPDMAVAAAALAVEASSRRERARWQVPPPQPLTTPSSNLQQHQQLQHTQLSSLLTVGESWEMTNSVDIAAVLGSTGLYHTDTHGADVWQADASEPANQHQQQHGHQQYAPSLLSNGGGGNNGESTHGTMPAVEFVRGQQEWQQQQQQRHQHDHQHQQQQQQQPSWEQTNNLFPHHNHHQNSRPEQQQQQQASSFYPLQPLQPAPATRAASPNFLRLLQQNHPPPMLPQQMGPAWQVLPPTNPHPRISGGGDGGPWVNSNNNATQNTNSNGNNSGYGIGNNHQNNHPSTASAHQLPRAHWQESNTGMGPPLYPPMPSTFSEAVHRNGMQSAQQLRNHQQQQLQQQHQQPPQQLQALEGYNVNGHPGYGDSGAGASRRVSNPTSETSGGASDFLPDYLRQSRSKLTTGWSASPHEAQQGPLSAFADVWSQKFNHNTNNNHAAHHSNNNNNNNGGNNNHNGSNSNGSQPQSQRNTGNGRQGTDPGSNGVENARSGPLGSVQSQGQQGVGYGMAPAGRGREGFEGLSLSEVLASKPKREMPNFKKKSNGTAPVIEAAS